MQGNCMFTPPQKFKIDKKSRCYARVLSLLVLFAAKALLNYPEEQCQETGYSYSRCCRSLCSVD